MWGGCLVVYTTQKEGDGFEDVSRVEARRDVDKGLNAILSIRVGVIALLFVLMTLYSS